MEKYKHSQGKEFSDLRRRKPPPLPMEDDGRRTTNKKMRMERLERAKECVNNGTNNDSGGATNSNSTTGSSSFQGSGSRRSRSPRPGFDPATSTPTGQKPQSPLSFSHGPGSSPGRAAASGGGGGGSKLVNWRLACFMAREYLSRGTLLGKPWPSQDSNPNPHKSKTPANATVTAAATAGGGAAEKEEESSESRRDKERLYCILTGDFLRSNDIHIPGIVNPTQLASWMGFK